MIYNNMSGRVFDIKFSSVEADILALINAHPIMNVGKASASNETPDPDPDPDRPRRRGQPCVPRPSEFAPSCSTDVPWQLAVALGTRL